jgi:hypothetical protein
MSLSERYVQWTHKGGLQGVWGAGLLAIFLPAGWYASGRPLPFSIILLVPIGGFAGYWIGKTIGLVTVGGAGATAQAFTMPATTGHYANEHSEILTLEVRGDFNGAVSAWEAVAIAEPGNPWPLVKSAELYADKLGDPASALDRFRLARSLPEIKPELKRYTTQKIIDLLLGPINDKGRAMVELRMLIDQWPDSREAEGARDALRNLKAQTPDVS